jgi:hypothetical protein
MVDRRYLFRVSLSPTYGEYPEASRVFGAAWGDSLAVASSKQFSTPALVIAQVGIQ